jgi:adenylate cyclase
MTAALTCRSCGAEPREGARFCDACGAPIEALPSAEYKQVTVLFVDVVRSMDIAAAEGPERLREIMADLLDRSTAVVHRYGGTLSQFTGDGIMAVFGAPITLEDHAFRACMAALDIQRDVGSTLQLRIGLNSGQVIAGEIGSSTGNYATIGEQVGMAQRMESVAPPGGVMLSESTARLVERVAVLGDPRLVKIKGADEPVPTRQLLAIGERQPVRRTETKLVGRSWELGTVSAILEESVNGAGCVVTVVGPPGIGKSRLIREAEATAADREVAVVTTYCESHTRDIPFHTIARLLRAGTGVNDLDAVRAREHLRNQFQDADPDDLVLLEDLLGIRDPATALPDVAPEAQRRRLTALITSASLATTEPLLYVIEDVHWIDEVSESMLADFLTVVPRTPVLTLITYRPEYRGPLSRIPGAQTIALRPLSEKQAATLTAQLLGAEPQLGDLAARVSERAGGNPFFAEEMVRDLAERGVLDGQPGAYVLCGDVGAADVPATLHATIGARIDRLDPGAKRTLTAAAVIGSRFDDDLLASLVDEPDVAPLIAAELVDQVKFDIRPEYAFRHPLIRAVAVESQLKSDRAQLHRRLATVIRDRDPQSADQNAALIAEHFEAAGDLPVAFEWHMRSASWVNYRDNNAATRSWQRAQQVADRLPDDHPNLLAMRIEPRTLLCATGFRVSGSGFASGFDELRDLCLAADDKRSLAIGMSGPIMQTYFDGRRRDASALATEQVQLLESIADPNLTLALMMAAISVKHETAEMRDILRLSQNAIDLAGGDATKGGEIATSSPLAFAVTFRGLARWCLGLAGWRDDFNQAVQMVSAAESVTRSGVLYYSCTMAILHGVILPSEEILDEMADILSDAEHTGEDVSFGLAKSNVAFVLLHLGGDSDDYPLGLLAEIRDLAIRNRYSRTAIPMVDTYVAKSHAQHGELDRAVALLRAVVDEEIEAGGVIFIPMAAGALVDSLLQRASDADRAEVQSVIDRVEAVEVDPGLVLYDIWVLRMRAQLAWANSDANYTDYRDRYRKMANDLGFEGHAAWAEAMP